jgi:GNAT superfamily N-acetyltransferase
MAATANSPSSDSQVRIRKAVDRDVPALTQLINAAFVVEQVAFEGDRVDSQALRRYMNAGVFLLAEDAAGLAGCVYVETHGERSYLGLLSVDPPRQGSGLGRRLMAEAENFARGVGSRDMDLRVISQRAGQLLSFYLRLGYRHTGTQPFAPDLASRVPGHYILLSKGLA